MSLLAAIPGLSTHEVIVSIVTGSFDFARADRLIAELNSAIGGAYPDEGCIRWLAANQPEAWTALLQGEKAVDTAYLAEDMAGLEKAADLLRRMYLKAFGLYTARPPVIEVQESFL